MMPSGSGMLLNKKALIPVFRGWKSCSIPVKYDKRRYNRRNLNEIMFGRLKD